MIDWLIEKDLISIGNIKILGLYAIFEPKLMKLEAVVRFESKFSPA